MVAVMSFVSFFTDDRRSKHGTADNFHVFIEFIRMSSVYMCHWPYLSANIGYRLRHQTHSWNLLKPPIFQCILYVLNHRVATLSIAYIQKSKIKFRNSRHFNLS